MQRTIAHATRGAPGRGGLKVHVRAPIRAGSLRLTQAGAIAALALLLRLAMGWMFAHAGFEKLLGGFTAKGFLLKATSGPLHEFWVSLGGSHTAVSVLDPLVVWGEILIGLALFFGVATRFALFWGAVMLFTFYLAQFPPKADPFLEYRLVYPVLFVMLGLMGAGRVLGLDALIERLPVVRRARWLKVLLG